MSIYMYVVVIYEYIMYVVVIYHIVLKLMHNCSLYDNHLLTKLET